MCRAIALASNRIDLGVRDQKIAMWGRAACDALGPVGQIFGQTRERSRVFVLLGSPCVRAHRRLAPRGAHDKYKGQIGTD